MPSLSGSLASRIITLSVGKGDTTYKWLVSAMRTDRAESWAVFLTVSVGYPFS